MVNGHGACSLHCVIRLQDIGYMPRAGGIDLQLCVIPGARLYKLCGAVQHIQMTAIAVTLVLHNRPIGVVSEYVQLCVIVIAALRNLAPAVAALNRDLGAIGIAGLLHQRACMVGVNYDLCLIVMCCPQRSALLQRDPAAVAAQAQIGLIACSRLQGRAQIIGSGDVTTKGIALVD